MIIYQKRLTFKNLKFDQPIQDGQWKDFYCVGNHYCVNPKYRTMFFCGSTINKSELLWPKIRSSSVCGSTMNAPLLWGSTIRKSLLCESLIKLNLWCGPTITKSEMFWPTKINNMCISKKTKSLLRTTYSVKPQFVRIHNKWIMIVGIHK